MKNSLRKIHFEKFDHERFTAVNLVKANITIIQTTVNEFEEKIS